jgi:hypothetical protein
MAAPDPPPTIARVVEVLDPGGDFFVVYVRMPQHLASKFPDKAWGAPITSIGLAPKDVVRFDGYVLVDIESVREDKAGETSDLLWVFQKLDGPVWSTKSVGQVNLTPEKYRKFLVTKTTKQEVVPGTAPDNVGEVLDTEAGETIIRSQVQDEENTGKAVKETVTEALQENLDPLVGGRTSPWGVLTSNERLVVEGSEVPHGEGISEASVSPFGNGKAEESTLLYPTPDATSGVIATLSDQDQDAVTSIVTDIHKELVIASKIGPRITALRTAGFFVEKKAQDQHHGVLIASKVDLSSLPGPEVYWDHQNLNMPDTLVSITPYFNTSQGGGIGEFSGDGGGSVSANASASISPSIGVELSSGFAGRAKARVTRSYVYGPPVEPEEGAINILPVTGSVVLMGSARNYSVTLKGSAASIGRSESVNVSSDSRMVKIGPFLSSGLSETYEQDVVAGPFEAIATGSEFSGDAGAEIAEDTCIGKIIIHAPASTPIGLAPDDVVMRFQSVSKWRLGIWVVETVEVFLP